MFRSNPNIMSLSRISDGKYIDVNETAVRAFGYSHDEVVGHTALELGIWAEPGERAKMIDQLKAKGIVSGMNTMVRNKSGEIFPVQLYANVIEVNGEKTILMTAIDVSGMAKAEQAVKDKMTELEEFQKLTVGRELKMMELEKEVNALLKELGREAKYTS